MHINDSMVVHLLAHLKQNRCSMKVERLKCFCKHFYKVCSTRRQCKITLFLQCPEVGDPPLHMQAIKPHADTGCGSYKLQPPYMQQDMYIMASLLQEHLPKYLRTLTDLGHVIERFPPPPHHPFQDKENHLRKTKHLQTNQEASGPVQHRRMRI